MEMVKDSSMAILSFVCLLNYFSHIKVSFMTNINVVLKRKENWPILLLLLLLLRPPVILLLILMLPVLL
jgi:hypothetical protein